MEYQTAIYLSQQPATQHPNGLSDTAFVDRPDLVAMSAGILRQLSFFRGQKGLDQTLRRSSLYGRKRNNGDR
jgi:hypothetical protein